MAPVPATNSGSSAFGSARRAGTSARSVSPVGVRTYISVRVERVTVSGEAATGRSGGFVSSLQRVLRGPNEARLRASWRVLLSWALLPLVALSLAAAMPLLGLSGMVAGGPVQALLFLGVLAAWAWAVDRRPLSDYGVSLSRPWLVDLLAGFCAVVVAHLLWYGLGVAGGWTTVAVSPTAPRDGLLVGLVGAWLSFACNAWVQDTVYFAVVLRNAAEGLRSRQVAPPRAALGGWLVAVLFFAGVHGIAGPVELADKLLAGALFGALYLYTGELALTVGMHWGVSATAGLLFPVAGSPRSVFGVTEALPGLVGTVSAHRMPQLVLGFALLVGWLRWRRGAVAVDTSVARWRRRGRGGPGTATGQRD